MPSSVLGVTKKKDITEQGLSSLGICHIQQTKLESKIVCGRKID